jgi:predicted ester cyclase
MSIKENQDLVNRYLLIAAAQVKTMLTGGTDSFHAPEFTYHGTMGDMNLKGYYQLMVTTTSIFPDYKNVVEDIVAQGDKVAARFTFNGTPKKPAWEFPRPTRKSAWRVSGYSG